MKKITFILGLFLTTYANAQVGNLDTSFADNGKAITSVNSGIDRSYSIQIQSDNKIVVAGFSFSSITGDDFICIRYNIDGSLDTSFGNAGIVSIDVQLGSDDRARSLDIQLDGKIILAGYSDDGSDRNGAVVRLNSDGSIDNTFGTNGVVITDFENNQQDDVNIVKIHDLTGNILVGGETTISSSLAKPVIVRYDSNGNLDTSFNSTGIRLLWIDSLDSQYKFSLEDLHVRTNGKITAVGWRDFPGLSWSSDYWACRVNSNGSMDTTFSNDGVNSYNGGFNGHDRAYSMLLKSNNNIILSGGAYIDDLNYDFAAFEITDAGAVATNTTRVEFDTQVIPQDIAYGMKEENNGKYILAGSSGIASERDIVLTRLNTDLTIDTDFGVDGKVVTTFNGNLLNEVFDVAIQTDNKIVVAGYTGNDVVVARYIVEENLSVDEVAIENFKIFPNPVSDVLNIDLSSYSFQELKILMYNVTGSVVFEKNLSLNIEQIDLKKLASGIYVYKLINNNNILKTGKVIKE